MSGVRDGLEIFVTCDWYKCGAQALVWSGDPADERPSLGPEHQDKLPPGWTWRDGRTYCRKHSR